MNKEEKKAYNAVYYQDHKEERKAYQSVRRNTPEGKAYHAAYNKSPVGKASQAAYDNYPEVKAKKAVHAKSPEGKAVRAAYAKTPEHKASKVAYDADRRKTPEHKASKAAYNKSPAGKASMAVRQDRRRAKKAGCVNLPIRKDIMDFLKEIYGDRCGYCRNPSDIWHKDHFMPIDLKGDHAEHNLVLACPGCNHSKGAKDPYIWLKEKGLSFTKPDYMLK